MKKLKINILEKYKSYDKDTVYDLEGDLIILSGVNGSGKSQLLQIISKNGKEPIKRKVSQIYESGESKQLENILLFSFRDNINLGADFGEFSVTYRKNNAEKAWEFYNNNIKYLENNRFTNDKRKRKFSDGSILFDDKGIKNPSWRSILQLIELIKCKYKGDEVFNLSQEKIESILPADFIWRNENDIVAQIGNLFYIACCNRVNKQIEYSKTHDVFNNAEWLKNAPWTILNQLFEDLNFKYRFKEDYEYKTPNMEENPKLRDESDIRSLMDLSDGEKAI